jgi:hypothetical protein
MRLSNEITDNIRGYTAHLHRSRGLGASRDTLFYYACFHERVMNARAKYQSCALILSTDLCMGTRRQYMCIFTDMYVITTRWFMRFNAPLSLIICMYVCMYVYTHAHTHIWFLQFKRALESDPAHTTTLYNYARWKQVYMSKLCSCLCAGVFSNVTHMHSVGVRAHR